MNKQVYYLIIIFTTLCDIILLTFVTFYPVSISLKYSVYIFDLVVCLVLWAEFIYSYYNADDKKRYLKDNYLSIIGMLPFDFIFLRALRLIKLVHLIKSFLLISDSTDRFSNFLKRTYLDKIIFVAIIFIFMVTILIKFADNNINDFSTAIWYIMVSLTSTGYGDIVPDTFSGKIIGITTMIGGILIFSTVTAVISSIYVSKINSRNRDSVEAKIEDLTSEIEKLNKKN